MSAVKDMNRFSKFQMKSHCEAVAVSRTDASILMVAPPRRLLKYIHYIKHKRAFLLRFDLREFTYIHPG